MIRKRDEKKNWNIETWNCIRAENVSPIPCNEETKNKKCGEELSIKYISRHSRENVPIRTSQCLDSYNFLSFRYMQTVRARVVLKKYDGKTEKKKKKKNRPNPIPKMQKRLKKTAHKWISFILYLSFLPKQGTYMYNTSITYDTHKIFVCCKFCVFFLSFFFSFSLSFHSLYVVILHSRILSAARRCARCQKTFLPKRIYCTHTFCIQYIYTHTLSLSFYYTDYTLYFHSVIAMFSISHTLFVAIEYSMVCIYVLTIHTLVSAKRKSTHMVALFYLNVDAIQIIYTYIQQYETDFI